MYIKMSIYHGDIGFSSCKGDKPKGFKVMGELG